MTKPDIRLTVDYSNLAKTYDASRYEGSIAEFRLSYVLNTITEMIEPTSNMKILDVATGTGKAALALADRNAEITALDYTDAMLRIAQQKTKDADYENIQFVKGDAANLPFESNQFDVVVSLNFLHLFTPVHRQKIFVREMHRVLRPGGMLVIELLNYYQGVFIGPLRKRFGYDLGFNGPGDLPILLHPEFRIDHVVGGHLPGMWRIFYPISKMSMRTSQSLASLTRYRPWKYFAFNLFIQATKA